MSRAWIAVLAAVLAGAAGCGGESPEESPPAVVLFTLDTFRADHLGCSGHPTVRTPHIDRLARRGRMWPEAVTPIPLTTPSHATILSGLSPRTHGLIKNRMRLAPWVTTLPQRLQEAGFRTAAVVSSPIVLDPELGLGRGFDEYLVIEIPQRPATGEGAQAADLATGWIRESGGPGSFLWVHFFDAHLPYLPPSPLEKLYDPDYDGRFARLEDRRVIQTVFEESDDVTPRDIRHVVSLYASEVTFLDRCLGRVVREARAAPRGEETTFVLTADHGEGLSEHEKYFGHDKILYDTSIRVPMIVSGPDRPAGHPGVVQEPARTVDVAPTVLAHFGLSPQRKIEGRDLLGDPPPTGDDLLFVAETYPAQKKSTPLYALRTRTHKVVWQPRERRWEFYDLTVDPGEVHDLSTTGGEAFDVYAADLKLDLINRPVGKTETIDEERGGADPEMVEALRSLGYVD